MDQNGSIKNRTIKGQTNSIKKCKNFHLNQEPEQSQNGGSLIDEFDQDYDEGIDPEEIDIAYDINSKLKYDPYNYNDDLYNENVQNDLIDYDELQDGRNYTSEDEKIPDFTKTWDYPLISNNQKGGVNLISTNQKGGVNVTKNKSGVVALKKIEYYQNQSQYCHIIPLITFYKLIKEISNKFSDKIRFSKESIKMIQFESENYIIDILNSANLQTLHANRIRVKSEDLYMVLKMKK